MKELFLLKNGEIVLKGQNRRLFEDLLIRNIKYRLKPLGKFRVQKAQSTIVITPEEDTIDLDLVEETLHCVFGIASICRSILAEKTEESIAKAAILLMENYPDAKTFKVEAKRSDKSFPMKSPEIAREFGGKILEDIPALTVDVHNPDVTVNIEVRELGAYVHAGNVPGAGGMPVSSAGKTALMLSGGIDSPVAGYLLASRGAQLVAVHFASPPYTSERALLKVKKLCKLMARYSGRIKLYTVPFTRAQEEIRKQCDDSYGTLLMRRLMCIITEQIAREEECESLLTGESLGQVASQTMGAILCTDHASTLPIFRPLIGLDKIDIIKIAKKIDTFETSILPYEDCCTVFTPARPKTKPKLPLVLLEEEKLDVEKIVADAIAEMEWENIDFLNA